MKHLLLTLFALLLLLCACSQGEELVAGSADTDRADAGSITLSFQMQAPGAATRIDAHDERESEWPDFEDKIDIDDMAFYIFLERKTDDKDHSNCPLLMKYTGKESGSYPVNATTTVVGSADTYYVVNITMPRTDFDQVYGKAITASSTGSVTFRIVMLANAMGAGAKDKDGNSFSYEGLADLHTTFGTFFEDAKAITYDLNSIYSSSEGDADITGLYKGAIPMFGMGSFSASEKALFNSRPEERVHLGTVSLLRSVAKVRVIDSAERTDGYYPRVAYACVESQTENVRLLPEVDADSYAGGQTHDVNIAEGNPGGNKTFKLGYLGSNSKVHFGYLPEQLISSESACPVIVLHVEYDQTNSKDFRIPMCKSEAYPNINFQGTIWRNHIYELEVTKILTGTEAQITVKVVEWQSQELELSYTEVPTIKKKLEWSGYEGSISADGEIVLKPWTTKNGEQEPVPLVGTFNIEGPVGATWSAYLIPLGEETGRFQFKEDNADTGSPLSARGTVDSSPTTIQIVSTDKAPTTQAKAKLQIVITVGGTNRYEVDLTPDGTSNYDQFTIVQNALYTTS